MRAERDLRKAGGIRAAIDEASCLRSRAQTARSSRVRIRRLILLTDAMIDELELENIKGIQHVSAAWWPRLALLFSSLPFDVGLPVRHPQTPVEVLDLVFEVQERLFAVKNGRPTRSAGDGSPSRAGGSTGRLIQPLARLALRAGAPRAS